MDIDKIVKQATRDMNKCYISVDTLTSRIPYISPNAKSRSFFDDPFFYPVYYHIGKLIQPKNMLDLTLGGGLPASCFLLGSNKVENFFGFNQIDEEFYSFRMPRKNIKLINRGHHNFYRGYLTDTIMQESLKSMKWDVVLMSKIMSYDDHLAYLRIIWQYISEGGLLIMDYINYHKPVGRVYKEFCLSQNKAMHIIPSKYGVGLIKK